MLSSEFRLTCKFGIIIVSYTFPLILILGVIVDFSVEDVNFGEELRYSVKVTNNLG
jgi:hypothetical protein